jgi:hypothetical protein
MTIQPRIARDRFIAAIEAHFDAVSTRRSVDDPRIDDAYAALADAFEVYDDALDQAFSELTPFTLDDPDEDDVDDDVEDDIDEADLDADDLGIDVDDELDDEVHEIDGDEDLFVDPDLDGLDDVDDEDSIDEDEDIDVDADGDADLVRRPVKYTAVK